MIRTIEQGEIFGEVALIFSGVRTATIVSENYTTLAYLLEKNFMELWDYSPDTFHMIKNHAIEYKDDPCVLQCLYLIMALVAAASMAWSGVYIPPRLPPPPRPSTRAVDPSATEDCRFHIFVVA